ncbi:MAG: hypothetical protein II956_15075 [Bacteroidales bacterium]|nr:hypothetical protein [Bacteroidales bacterium]
MFDQSIFDTPYYVIDIFPLQIPEQRSGAYFAAEKFFLQEPHLLLLRQKFARVIIKLCCYFDFVLERDNELHETPSPEFLYDTITTCKPNDYLTFFFPQQNCAIIYSSDDLYMTLYNADEDFAKLTAQICSAEGVFLRR